MSTNAGDKLRSILSALDEWVPREGSWIQLSQYGGGPDEGQIIGNPNGYRRLGIEFMKATLENDPERNFGVDLEYLISPDSTINFDWFELSDTPRKTKLSCGWSDRLLSIGCLTFLVLAATIALIGVETIVQWIAK